jgi:hypothetical protein
MRGSARESSHGMGEPMANDDWKIEGNAFNEERVDVTGKRSRGLGPGPKWPTERRDALVFVLVAVIPLLGLLLLMYWLR